MIDENYYIFIEDENEKFVIRITKKINWITESIDGNVPYDLDMETYNKECVIDDILEELRDTYDYVQEINYSDIIDYME